MFSCPPSLSPNITPFPRPPKASHPSTVGRRPWLQRRWLAQPLSADPPPGPPGQAGDPPGPQLCTANLLSYQVGGAIAGGVARVVIKWFEFLHNSTM